MYVPKLAKNLLSVKAATNHCEGILFRKNDCVLITNENKDFTIGHGFGGLYKLNS